VKIDDGSTGNVAQVTTRHELKSYASVEEEFKRISEEDGEAYIWTNETYDYAAADTILLVRNDHQTKNLHIWKIHLHGDTETEVEVHVPTATFTIAGTAVVGEPLNRSIDNTAQATAKADETGNTQGDVVERRRIKANIDDDVDFVGALVLKYNQAIGVDYVTDGAEAHVSIWGYFK
jgi:hypothetical protein